MKKLSIKLLGVVIISATLSSAISPSVRVRRLRSEPPSQWMGPMRMGGSKSRLVRETNRPSSHAYAQWDIALLSVSLASLIDFTQLHRLRKPRPRLPRLRGVSRPRRLTLDRARARAIADCAIELYSRWLKVGSVERGSAPRIRAGTVSSQGHRHGRVL